MPTLVALAVVRGNALHSVFWVTPGRTETCRKGKHCAVRISKHNLTLYAKLMREKAHEALSVPVQNVYLHKRMSVSTSRTRANNLTTASFIFNLSLALWDFESVTWSNLKQRLTLSRNSRDSKRWDIWRWQLRKGTKRNEKTVSILGPGFYRAACYCNISWFQKMAQSFRTWIHPCREMDSLCKSNAARFRIKSQHMSKLKLPRHDLPVTESSARGEISDNTN